jgi:hypothetical protein
MQLKEKAQERKPPGEGTNVSNLYETLCEGSCGDDKDIRKDAAVGRLDILLIATPEGGPHMPA